MKLLQQKLAALDIGWNQRVFDEAVFHALCHRFSITVVESPMDTGGFYYRLLGRDFIAINSKLSGIKRLVVLFHELGHFLLHVPKSGPAANFYATGGPTRQQREADTFALCALLPIELIRSRTTPELIHDGFPLEMIASRLAIFERYRI